MYTSYNLKYGKIKNRGSSYDKSEVIQRLQKDLKFLDFRL